MIAFLTKSQSRWISLTFRQPPTGATVAPKANLSTAPPEPVIPSKKPIKVELIGGKHYSWCSCGYSRKQMYLSVFKPFCDGAHKTRAQGMTPLRFVPEKDSTVWLCGCKHTNNPPYCDGTHKQDFIVSAPVHEYTD
ncbi:CDGSH iron-sulfur domain-containing protein 3, mitochondrial-like isoform X1 [Girardinichthys multiradiatus]|uniref:CDGSH iron-sulfur domain-containing protein 3, mitochondrial-like isoform X1 n=1 Tax=Girardinichthys multiradiatus TaxID=208333 RepID=UPI001FAB4697|nr:CDGSH iron-sulfur domain-containing protein 3, mitochondrial-like isoform X1 [Girardinichthys multiradiatus]